MTERMTAAMKLLRSYLSPDQRDSLTLGEFTEISRGGRHYTIQVAEGGICVREPGGVSYCVRTDRTLPAPDQALIMVLAIRADPEGFRNTVNHETRWPRRTLRPGNIAGS